mmetsp:Transcript_88337/g.152971  ORF Transcript_88337/g.152971 Transcript_88337/m.152971 type:complete len:478 (-) Transcript_88337:297-1730(-)
MVAPHKPEHALKPPHNRKRSSTCGRAQWEPLVLSRCRSKSVPYRTQLPPELARRPPESCAMEFNRDQRSFTGHIADALSCSSSLKVPWQLTTVAVVGGGPAGLCAAMALIKEHMSAWGTKMLSAVPSLSLTIFEKRPEALRRQHVFVDVGRLPLEVSQELRLNKERLSELLSPHGAVLNVPGASVELRVLEFCLQQLLYEVCRTVAGHISVRWESNAFKPSDVFCFNHVIGADGRRSAVRDLLMARIPRVQLVKCALEVEFGYNCDLEFLHQENVHVLKAHRYQKWQPVLLYHKLLRSEGPDYINLHRCNYEAVQSAFRNLTAQGKTPYTTPFDSAEAFLEMFAGQPHLQDSLRQALEANVEDFDITSPALITPVDQTLHRAPHLVSVKNSESSLWIVGDAAVGLPVSKGCNLVYHMAAAGRLAAALLTQNGDAKEEAAAYEEFVFNAWHGEAWREGRHASLQAPIGCTKRSGRFVR